MTGRMGAGARGFSGARAGLRAVAAAHLALAATSLAAAPCGPVEPIAVSQVLTGTPAPAQCDERAMGWITNDEYTIWRCGLRAADGASGDEGESADDALIVMRGDVQVHQQPDFPSLWGDAGLVVLRVDLTGDGVGETVIAAHNTSGQGMGIEHWTLTVLGPDGSVLASEEEIADWGPAAFVPRAPQDGKRPAGCALLLTEWRDVEEADGTPTKHLVGWRAALGSDAAPQGDFVTRRYDRKFERERIRDIERTNGPERDPARWLKRQIAAALAAEMKP